MMEGHDIHPAEERLLDAALSQHFARRRNAARTNSPRWLAAALLLLGIGVVVATTWLARSDARDEAQEPEPLPLPPEVTCTGATGLRAQAPDTEHVLAKLVDPRELSAVARFERLRGLRLLPESVRLAGIDTGVEHGAWTSPPTDLLRPLAALPLEVLRLPRDLFVTPALLAPLAGHPTLRELQLVGEPGGAAGIDDAFVAALAAIPRLRALHLMFAPVDATSLQRVARLPLASLELEFCSGLDAAGWQALLSMRTLRRLAFKEWAWRAGKRADGAAEPWRPAPDDLRRLRELPRLCTLELLRCGIADEDLAVLPDTLSTLRLVGHRLTPGGLDGLRRLGGLRALDLGTTASKSTLADLFSPDSVAGAEAFAAALASLHLQSLTYRGALPVSVGQAIGSQGDLRDLTIVSRSSDAASAVDWLGRLRLQRLAWRAPIASDLLGTVAAQPRLRELELSAEAIPGLGPLARAPVLERLTLNATAIGDGVVAASLAPLARAASLRWIDVRVNVARGAERASEADLQRAVGERIRVQLHETELTVKR